MAVSESLAALLTEHLAPLGRISVRRMFSGAGVYCDSLMFGLIAGDTLYFKTGDGNRAAYEAEGLEPFTYEGKTKPVRLPYWRVPERLFDNPEEMVVWARAALAAARRTAADRKPAKRSRTRRPASAPARLMG